MTSTITTVEAARNAIIEMIEMHDRATVEGWICRVYNCESATIDAAGDVHICGTHGRGNWLSADALIQTVNRINAGV